jgi:hypothetical protein
MCDRLAQLASRDDRYASILLDLPPSLTTIGRKVEPAQSPMRRPGLRRLGGRRSGSAGC